MEDVTLVCGAHARHFVIDAASPFPTIGVHFRPGGAFPFIGMPADLIADTHVPLDALWGAGAAAELRERLLQQPNHVERFRLLEQVLLDRLRDPAASHHHPGATGSDGGLDCHSRVGNDR